MHRLVVVATVFAVVAGCAQPERPQHPNMIDNGGMPGTPSPAAGGPQDCGSQEFTLTKVPPNIMLVLDRSASMDEPIATASSTSKYDDLKSAIGSLVSRYDESMRFGATFFAADDDCAPGVVGDIAAQNGATISSQIAAHAPGGNTPTATTLEAVIASKALVDTSRANYLVLATDGVPNCDDVDVQRRINALYSSTPSVRTFVIGIGSETDTNPELLDAWADDGHTARAGNVHYYQTNSPADLDAAFDAIAGDIASCDFTLSGAPDDPTLINVAENGVAISPSPTVGWTFDPSTHTVTLHGVACDAIKNDAQTKVSVAYGCPSLGPIY
jgi:hypothetical protein